LILSAANTIGATIGAGATLQIGDGGTSGTIGNVTDNGTLVFNRSDALTHSGTISGTGSVQKSGAGTLTFNNAKTYSGSTSVSDSGKLLVSSTLLNSSGFNVGTGATLELGATNLFVSGHGTAMAASRVIAVNGGTLLMNNSFAARFGNVSLSNGATWTSNQGLSGYDALLSDTTAGAATVTVSGTGVSTMNGSGGIHLAGVQNFDVAEVTASSDPDLIVSMILGAQGTTGGAAGGINKLGAGTMALSGTNTYSGGTTVTAGTLQVGNGGTTGTMGSGAVTNNAALVLNYGIGASVGLGNVISGTGSLTKQGLGLVALNGASDYNGTTTVSEGTLRIGNSLVNSPVTVQSGGIIGAGSQSTVGTGAVKSLTLASGSASTFRVGFPSDQLVINDVDGLTIGGSHVVTAVFTGGLNPGDTVPIIDYTGSLGGGGFANLSLAPGSRFTLSNNPVDTSIDLTYTGGTLTWEGKLSTAWDLNTTANWNLGGSPTYFLTGDAALFDDSATSGSVVLSGTQTPSSLTINNETLAYTLSGGTLGGTGLVNKLGTGVATITSDTTYGGATWIDAGTLTFGDGATSGQIGTGVVEILPGGTLRINRSDLLDYKASPRLRTLTGAGDIVVEGGGTLFNYPGTGTSFADATSWAGFSGNLTIRGGSEFQTIRNGATAMGTGTVILGDATTSGSLSQIEGSWTWTNHISLVGSANKILNRSNATQSRMLKLQGVISGSGGLSFEDPGISMINNNRGFILTGTNTMDGTLTIPAGVPVRVGGVPGDTDVNQSGAGISGSLGTATVVADGTLTFSRTDAHSVTNAISGSGALRVGIPLVDGYGDTTTQVLTYTGTASHTGLTTVNNGTLIVGSGGSMGGSSVTVAATGTLGGEGTLAAPLTAAGTIAPGVGVGTLTVADTVLTGTYLCELDGTGADKLSANALDITGATLAFSVTNAPSAASYTIATYTGALGGSFASTTVPAGYALDYTTAGQINLVAVAVPGYTAWATTNAAGGTFNADFDNDGMPNGMEYFMGATGSSFTSNPKPVNGVVSFPRDATASGVVYKVLTSPNLTTWTDKTADADNSDPAFVKYTLPTGQGKIFVRLEVIQN
jgi:autotransporter-associated beta strand protein